MNKIVQFFREAYAELRRVTWPTRAQTVQYTTLVVIISVGVAAFLGTLDYFFGIGVKEFLLPSNDVVSPTTIENALEGLEDDGDSVQVNIDGDGVVTIPEEGADLSGITVDGAEIDPSPTGDDSSQ